MLTAPPLIGRSHPGINFSRVEIPADVGGLVFTVGVVVTMLIGLPAARLFLAAAFGGGVVLAILLAARSAPARRPPTRKSRATRVGRRRLR
jgi:hypothetical protein